jgi:dCMP deaminase
MNIATEVAWRATCDRKHVGCVLVDPTDNVILATGYNGSVRGEPHCDDVGHDMEDGHCVRTVHAESNAVAQAARKGARLAGARCYVTCYPCWPCFRLLANAGVREVVYADEYRADRRVRECAERQGIKLIAMAMAGE